MVTLEQVKTVNAATAAKLPLRLVAVFVGATSGIGEYTLKAFARYASKPRAYFIGRSQEAGDRISKELQELNPDGSFIFIKADTSLIRNVDALCKDLQSREVTINLLFLSIGTLVFGTETEEKLHLGAALPHYCRYRFIQNLLPLIENATYLRRVISVFAGTKEGPFDENDIPGFQLTAMRGRGHRASLVSMGLMALQQKSPSVTFVHDYPGPVRSGIGRATGSLLLGTLGFIWFNFLAPWFNIPDEESGERHLFLVFSEKYGSVMPIGNSSPKHGFYVVDQNCELGGPDVMKLLESYREQGLVARIASHTQAEFDRIKDEM